MISIKKLELINELKALKEQKGLTYQQIADITEENGEAVSVSSIKKLFSDRYDHDPDYEHTLRPIAEALSPPVEGDNLEESTFRTRLQIKEEIIGQLKERLDNKEEKWRMREEFLMDELAFYREQIKWKDEQIKRLNEAIDRKDGMLRELLVGDKE